MSRTSQGHGEVLQVRVTAALLAALHDRYREAQASDPVGAPTSFPAWLRSQLVGLTRTHAVSEAP